MDIAFILASVGISFLAGIFVGRWRGKRQTIQLFRDLQDSGELVVTTKEQRTNQISQDNVRSLLRNEEDSEDLDEISHKRRDSPERRVDWAASMVQGRQQRGDEE